MNRLTPVLYIRSTLAGSRTDLRVTKNSGTVEKPTQLEKPELSVPAGHSESESVAVRIAGKGSTRPRPVRRESSSFSALRNISSPFRGEEPSGETPTSIGNDPFERVETESISVGLVPVHIPRLTDPIAPCTGFAMQAEVVKHASRFTEFRKAQQKTFSENTSKAAESEGGLFFASRKRGRSPQLNVSNGEHLTDGSPSQRSLVDYIKVDIPDISITLPGT
ncbi:hypothetical protein B0F90DRAFT_1369571 [Multifurca ochricompacta]|uniref:Uncharacterized protein n=1 Tax=Multifurca ochricompacta TaxID=376703 RepID=A0AAD4QPJ9_9AGAM|nr:hypothetical protein B0F90DRAFT_1369571 [Multifurca ochricompacta]